MDSEFELDGSEAMFSPVVQRRGDSIEVYQGELDDYFAEMRGLNGMEPTQVLQKLSSWSARASEIRSQLVRVDSRRSNSFRTREIDPFLEECDRQFRIHSRLQSVRETEWRMAGGNYV